MSKRLGHLLQDGHVRKARTWPLDEMDENPDSEYVYVIQSRDGGAFKVGVTKTPKKRLYMLQNGNPLRLSYLTLLEKDDAYGFEKAAHAALEQWRMNGEWFWPTHECVKELVRLFPELDGEVWIA